MAGGWLSDGRAVGLWKKVMERTESGAVGNMTKVGL